eukprot:scaffold198_cov169-Ochromonas_danica.AAC.16
MKTWSAAGQATASLARLPASLLLLDGAHEIINSGVHARSSSRDSHGSRRRSSQDGRRVSSNRRRSRLCLQRLGRQIDDCSIACSEQVDILHSLVPLRRVAIDVVACSAIVRSKRGERERLSAKHKSKGESTY